MDLQRIIRDRRHARLLGKARRGDRKAFRALFDALHDPVHAYLDRRIRDIHDVEDLVAIVFLKMTDGLAAYDPRRGSVTAWVMTMARNALVDHLRRRREAVDVDVVAEVLAGPGLDPLEGVLRSERAEGVRRGLATLPPETRELISLRYGEEMRHAEIAAVTGLSEAAVRQRLSRAVKTLRERVVGKPEEEGEVDYAIR